MNVIQLAIVTGLLALWTFALLVRDQFGGPVVTQTNIKFTHALPAIIQVILFVYWATYWPRVIEHMPVLCVQIVIAYVFEFLLVWTLRRPYTFGLGPLPIVLSTNLFVWFAPGDIVLDTLVIAIALSSKALVLSGGRHIFNPSVLGISVVGIFCIVLPRWFSYQDISSDFGRPPYMMYLILLLALIPQVRLRTTPLTVGAAFAMIGIMMVIFALTGYKKAPSPWWPPWLLAITLLAPDPATIPVASVARLLFGLFLGTAFYITSKGLAFLIGTDFFSKVIPITVANMLVPSFERAGARLSARWPNMLRESTSPVYVAAWVSLWVLILIVSRGA